MSMESVATVPRQSSSNPSDNDADSPIVDDSAAARPQARGFKFWMSFLSICSALGLFALELTSVSTALPTIVKELHATDFVWIGASYALASTAFLPMVGGLSQTFGRKPVLVGSILLFALGSALCGAANSNAMLVAGRTVQGTGGGAIVNLSDIVLGDLVPLRDRGFFFGLIGLTWALFCAIGPVVGGGLASAGAWRWLFYLNLPICGFCIFVTVFFMELRAPRLTFSEKMARMDWGGNLIVVGSSAACALGLTWGGIEYSWGSAQVLVPLCIGLAGLLLFFVYESRWATEPIIPYYLMSDRTSASGYLQNFFSPVLALAAVYFIPIYYQACKGSSPLLSGVQTLGLAAIAPAAIVGGVMVGISQKYRPPLWAGWCLTIIGFGLLTTITANDPSARTIGFSVIAGSGIGVIYSVAQFPVQAPHPTSENARSMTFYAFVRAFASIWGITMGNAILQNELRRRLPAAYIAQFPNGVALAYAIIPELSTLTPSLREEVRLAFAESLAILWKALTGVAGVGLLSSLLMREIPLHTETDKDWDLTAQDEKDVEKIALNPI
ncbi:MFS general substrate transporter [Fomitopsis serialis]|uniref:MFS general substrate transporter n=1 Tax=Fomitopsis serialis TaxID=139415 RepID=UPI002008BD8A|nr:MFS general substrate transporter [Neoantrodia serialis]KAH9920285.1 MFS general substrate transporter [Neoantrodia serialis]